MTTVNIDTIDDLGKFLDTPQKKHAWIKLDKNSKKNAVVKFVDDYIQPQNNLSDEDSLKCKSILIDLINKKKLSKAKDITFNIENQCVEKIPCLTYENGEFIIAVEKRPCTSKSLPNMKQFVRTASKKPICGGKQKLSFNNDAMPDAVPDAIDISNNV
mgnify:CR=1 FL=1